MATGPVPKDPAQRRRRNEPARGEWVDLPELEKPVLPSLPRRPSRDGGWSARTKAVWSAWRADRVTSQYAPSDVAAAVELAWLFEEYVRGAKVAAEVRQRMDGLGLTPKGKRDLRWRVPAASVKPSERPLAPV